MPRPTHQNALQYLSIILLCCLFPSTTAALTKVELIDGQDRYNIGSRLSYLNDSDAPLNFAQIRAESLAFMPNNTPLPRLGTGHSAWVRVHMHNQSKKTQNWIIEIPQISHEHIELYIPTQDSKDGWVIKRTGSLYPFSEREIKHPHYAFNLEIEKGAQKTIYLHFQYVDVGVLFLPITLWHPNAFHQHSYHMQIALGIFYGIILVMVLYNLFLFISLRDRAYLYYVFTLGFAGLFFALQNGIAAEYIWPAYGFRWSFLDLLFLGTFYIASCKFVQNFLLTKQRLPRLHQALWLTIVIWATMIAFGAIGFPGAFRPLARFSLASLCLILTTAILSWRKGFRPARFFVIGWALPIAVGIMLNLVDFHIFSPETSLMYHTQVGMTIGLVMFSLGLADRINLLRQEKEKQAIAAAESTLRARNLELEKQSMEQELHTAHDMQMDLMPTEELHIDNIKAGGRCLPAKQVGGDFFSYLHTGSKVLVSLADVAGHAMEAAIPAVKFSGILDADFQHYTGVEEIFQSLNHVLHRTLSHRCFVCFSFVELDLTTQHLRVSNAGCPPPYHYCHDTEQLIELELYAYPLGIREKLEFPVYEARLKPGDYLILYSDGIVESENEQGDQLGFDRTADLISQACQNHRNISLLIDQIFKDVDAFRNSKTLSDDTTCVVLGNTST